MDKKYEVPKCPNCGKELKTVCQIEYSSYNFNKTTGTYDEDGMTGDLEVQCDCGVDLVDDVFTEGVVNFQQEEGDK